MSAQESQHPYGVLTKKRVLIFSAAGVFLVAGLSALVGSVGAPGEASFDWTLASVFGTALGTTLLAAFTGALAYTTSGDVRATFDLANLARADQERQETPVVVLQSIKWHQEEKTKGRLGVECRNVGLGPALGIVVNPSFNSLPTM